MSVDGESTATWAMRQPGFFGTARELTHCCRCGEGLPAKPHNEPRHYLRGTMLVTCDACFSALPD